MTEGAGAPLLEVRDLRLGFDTAQGTTPVLHGIDLDVRAGETVGIVGESGSGKTALALAVARLHPPNAVVSGRVLLGGVDLYGLPERAARRARGLQIGFVFQSPLSSLNPVATIGRQMCEAVRVHKGMSRRAARRRALELLNLVGISDPARRFDQYPHQLSGGMLQRVMTAAALMPQPPLLIADEPTTALDVTIQAQILELLRTVQQEFSMAIILITHDLGVVAGLADRITVLYAGRVAESGPAAEMLAAPRHPYTRGLLDALPRLDRDRTGELEPIPGTPLSPSQPVTGCPFAPRCRHAFDRCADQPAVDPAADWSAACWLPPGPTARAAVVAGGAAR
jgi:oligopeptide/dipeptide ABC transporter ATP-binding protein